MRNNSQPLRAVELLAICSLLVIARRVRTAASRYERGDSDRADASTTCGRSALPFYLGRRHDERVRADAGERRRTMESPKAGSDVAEWATFTTNCAALLSSLVPRTPACASRRVRQFSTGFFNTGFRANALSYIGGLHAVFDYPQTSSPATETCAPMFIPLVFGGE